MWVLVKRLLSFAEGVVTDLKDESTKTVLETKEILDMRKRAGVPDINPDALPSSYCQKLLVCLNKRNTKRRDLKDACPTTNEKGEHILSTSQQKKLASILSHVYTHATPSFCNQPNQLCLRMYTKIGNLIQELEELEDKLDDARNKGIVDGFSPELFGLNEIITYSLTRSYDLALTSKLRGYWFLL